MLCCRDGGEDGEQFTLPLSILTGKVFRSSNVLRLCSNAFSDPDAASGNSAPLLLRETHKAAVVTNSARNGKCGN